MYIVYTIICVHNNVCTSSTRFPNVWPGNIIKTKQQFDADFLPTYETKLLGLWDVSVGLRQKYNICNLVKVVTNILFECSFSGLYRFAL